MSQYWHCGTPQNVVYDGDGNVSIPEGYRRVEAGEIRQDGDSYADCFGRWSPVMADVGTPVNDRSACTIRLIGLPHIDRWIYLQWWKVQDTVGRDGYDAWRVEKVKEYEALKEQEKHEITETV